MKAEGRKETIRQFKVSAAGFMASVVCNKIVKKAFRVNTQRRSKQKNPTSSFYDACFLRYTAL